MVRAAVSAAVVMLVVGCSVNDVTNDGGPDTGTPDIGAPEAGHDAGKDVGTTDASDGGCMTCVVGTSTVGNCCVQ